MSSLVGIYNLDGCPVDAQSLQRMLASMPHRSPDDSGIWHVGPVGLGHGMLHTTPESLTEHLPICSPCGRFTLTADARIDNREELMQQLGIKTKEVADSALILAAYQRWEEACPEHLMGAFSFALWDDERHRLFCARDHLGVNPFVYIYQPGALYAFGTEIKALLTLPSVVEEIDVRIFVEGFMRQIREPEKTIFKGIRNFLPAHAAVIDANGMRSWRYWTPSCEPSLTGWSEEAYTERFLELFSQAVQCRLRSAFPIGAELSGGLDSSFVTCRAHDILKEQGRGPLHTISLIYEHSSECDERKYIQEVLDQGDYQAHFAVADNHGLFSLLDEIFDYLDDGRAGGQHHLNWLTLRTARQAGARVLLTGQDGDTTVYHGWEVFAQLAEDGRWEEFAEEARLAVANISAERSKYALQEDVFSHPRAILNAYAGVPLREMARRRDYWQFIHSVESVHTHFGVARREIYSRFWKDLFVPSILQNRGQKRPRMSSPWSPLLNVDVVEQIGLQPKDRHQTHLGVSLRERQREKIMAPELTASLEKLNHYAAANGVEARHPFMDIRLVDYCLRLPADQSFKKGWSRAIMRRAMRHIVPDPVRDRMGKANLTPGYARVLTLDKQMLEKQLDQLDRAGGVFDEVAVHRLVEASKMDKSKDLAQLGLVLSLTFWLEKRNLNISLKPVKESESYLNGTSTQKV